MFKVDACVYKLSTCQYPLIYEYMHLKTLIEGYVSAETLTDEICLMIPKKKSSDCFFYCEMQDLLYSV